ncbi:hypothetical protein FAVG1_13055 [Fusarium avenaceum]|nr:hypothetical protein FAVG1_13055 [Fusarium avenaceum]
MEKIAKIKLDEISHKKLNKPYFNTLDRVNGEEERLVWLGRRVCLLISRSEETQGAYMARGGLLYPYGFSAQDPFASAATKPTDSHKWYRLYARREYGRFPARRVQAASPGATHWQYSTHHRQTSASLDSFILGHYNEAISQLRATGASALDLSTILTCCILFVILESLRGDFSEAVRHLESGIRILANNPKTYLPNRDFQELATIFHAISSQVAIFSPERVFPDVIHLLPPAKEQKKWTDEFRDLDEAEDVMNKFDDRVSHISWDLDQDWEDETSECNTKWKMLKEDVDEWERQFEVLVQKLTKCGQWIDKEKVLNLRIQHKLWEILIQNESEENESEAGLDATECNLLLDQLEQLWCNPTRPRFGLKIDLTAALYQLYVYCDDIAVRQRIILLLRSHRRREIIWDSAQLADFLDMDMAQRAIGLQQEKWPDIGPSSSDKALLTFRPKE